MSYDDIQRFRNLTGLENVEEINYWLESGNSLDNALELYFGSLNVKDSISAQAIRKPDQPKRARLISEVDDISRSLIYFILFISTIVIYRGGEKEEERGNCCIQGTFESTKFGCFVCHSLGHLNIGKL